MESELTHGHEAPRSLARGRCTWQSVPERRVTLPILCPGRLAVLPTLPNLCNPHLMSLIACASPVFRPTPPRSAKRSRCRVSYDAMFRASGLRASRLQRGRWAVDAAMSCLGVTTSRAAGGGSQVGHCLPNDAGHPRLPLRNMCLPNPLPHRPTAPPPPHRTCLRSSSSSVVLAGGSGSVLKWGR